MHGDIKRWTAVRDAALIMKVIQDKTTVVVARRSFDPAPSEIEY
jgi:hypothetical protein